MHRLLYVRAALGAVVDAAAVAVIAAVAHFFLLFPLLFLAVLDFGPGTLPLALADFLGAFLVVSAARVLLVVSAVPVLLVVVLVVVVLVVVRLSAAGQASLSREDLGIAVVPVDLLHVLAVHVQVSLVAFHVVVLVFAHLSADVLF